MPGRERRASLEAIRREVPGSLVACESSAFLGLYIGPQVPYPGYSLIGTDDHWVPKGTKDAIWPDVLARDQIKLFTSSPSSRVTVLDGGSHFLSVTHAPEVNPILVEMIKSYS